MTYRRGCQPDRAARPLLFPGPLVEAGNDDRPLDVLKMSCDHREHEAAPEYALNTISSVNNHVANDLLTLPSRLRVLMKAKQWPLSIAALNDALFSRFLYFADDEKKASTMRPAACPMFLRQSYSRAVA